MGSSKKQTVSHWYHPVFQIALHQGPYDKFLRVRGGDVDAWSGVLTASGTITIGARNLWGGEEKEGGIEGPVDIMFGEMDAQPNAYFQSAIGGDPSGHNGVALLQFNGGRYGAGNPYPKRLSVMTERILKGWEGDLCWYPEKAPIEMGVGSAPEGVDPSSGGWRYLVTLNSDTADYSAADFDDSGWDVGASPFASSTGHPYAAAGGFPNVVGTFWQLNRTIWARRQFTIASPSRVTMEIFVDNWATVWVNGVLVLPRVGSTNAPGVAAFLHEFVVPSDVLNVGSNTIVLKAEDYGSYSYAAFRVTGTAAGWAAMNPAHVIYDSLTCLQGEPVASIDDASFRSAADRLYAEGFGICTRYNHDKETVEQFRRRILDLIGAECSTDPVTGLWNLDLIRGVSPGELDDLLILTDDDILDFQDDPTTLDDAVNQVAVKWFDPETKQERTTAAVHALGLINAMGTINAETNTYPEVPLESLAIRLAARDLHNKATPTWRQNLVTNRKLYRLRIGRYFRLQALKRGIADMVCLLADRDKGTLQSGAIKALAVQDIHSMPATSYVAGQPPVPSPSPVPEPVVHQQLVEAPYVELAGVLSAADLAALDVDAAYLLAMGVRPDTGHDYQLLTRLSGGEFDRIGIFDWCPSATVVEASGYLDESFTLAGGTFLHRVETGTAALWGDELVRVDALDLGTGAVTLGRACGDTVPARHAAGERVYFFDTWAGVDSVEYATSETAEAKLLTRTGTQELEEGEAALLSVSFAQRAARPYPPASLLINGDSQPGTIVGDIVLTWSHRDRVAQADQLVDQAVGDVGPEPGTTYTARFYLNDALAHTEADIATNTCGWTPAGGGLLRIELESVRDGLVSWQMQVREVVLGTPLLAENGDLITTEDDEPILME